MENENEIKLIELSEDSWHYKLMLWFLGDNTPKPSNTFNFCRYFWILMFCLVILVPIAGPFKLLYNLIIRIADFIYDYIVSASVKGLEKWIIKLDAYTAFLIYAEGTYDYLPKKYKKIPGVNRDVILADWAKEAYGLNWFDVDDREKIKIELIKIHDERKKLNADRDKKRAEENRKAELKEQKREELINKINKKLSFLSTGWDKLITFINKIVDLDFTTMIKVAKKVTGVLITLVFLVLSYFVVNYLTLGLIATGVLIISIWKLLFQITLGIVIGVIISFLVFKLINYISSKIEDIRIKYKNGGSVWYIQVLYLIIIKPLYYLIYKPLYWIVLIPLNFIFNHLLWRFLCLKVFKSFGIWIWTGIKNFTGIFGDYFSASKKDYCPGIKWVEKK